MPTYVDEAKKAIDNLRDNKNMSNEAKVEDLEYLNKYIEKLLIDLKN